MAGDKVGRHRGRIGRSFWRAGCQFGHEGALDAEVIRSPHPEPAVPG
jgi:hypothetical protein